jgi:hypothetical protein
MIYRTGDIRAFPTSQERRLFVDSEQGQHLIAARLNYVQSARPVWH